MLIIDPNSDSFNIRKPTLRGWPRTRTLPKDHNISPKIGTDGERARTPEATVGTLNGQVGVEADDKQSIPSHNTPETNHAGAKSLAEAPAS